MTAKDSYKSGFAAIVGRPNVGKSTLLNRLVGQKIAIVSDKPQTTRHKIHSVITREDAQLVLLDTPGIHKPKHRLGEYMVEVALGTLKEVDVILFVVETETPGPGDTFILEQMKRVTTPVLLVINKIDRIAKHDLLPLIEGYRQLYDFKEIVPVSALNGENVERLTDLMVNYLPAGPKYYPDDMVTDRPERFIMAELIREKVLHLTSQEVPHSVAVVVEDVAERANGVVAVRAIVYTERDSQKRILIGKSGAMLKRIGQQAREEMEALFGSKFFLELWVKVKADWRNKDSYISNFGYTPER
ncbi:GTP-binding protein Era [Desulfocucumis palustris]|uniref:GTPase Era n=1 Tax=Desulfocucumis palustris TaxID=1898651 RepID=A0A2L2XC02_9FIRM|nr:GTPase Era [Desulfocucumis palustris]GBF33758.1 GTP-binding protein Era [Desulfocucumis palustris]